MDRHDDERQHQNSDAAPAPGTSGSVGADPDRAAERDEPDAPGGAASQAAQSRTGEGAPSDVEEG